MFCCRKACCCLQLCETLRLRGVRLCVAGGARLVLSFVVRGVTGCASGSSVAAGLLAASGGSRWDFSRLAVTLRPDRREWMAGLTACMAVSAVRGL